MRLMLTDTAQFMLLLICCAVVAGTLIGTIFLFVRYRQMARILAYLTRGKRGAQLEDTIATHAQELAQHTEKLAQLARAQSETRTQLRSALQHVHVLRYNPFKDLGGDQSFAMALLNEDGDGVVISSLHTRDGTRIYAKPLRNATSEYQLSNEERDAIAHARKSSPQ